MRRSLFFSLITLIVISLLFYYKLAFTDMILARGDTLTYFYPYWDVRNQALLNLQLPLWSSDIFMGIPLLANPQLGTYYLPNWLLAPFSAPDAVRYSILLHIGWAAVGMFLCFRKLISADMMPALLAAIVFAFGGYVSAHVEQINQLQGIAWLPWLVYLVAHMNQQENWLRCAILLAMAWAQQIFSGHTQTVFISGVALGILSLVPISSGTIKFILTRVGRLGLATLFAILLAIPQLLPTLELTGMSNRGGGFNANEATAFSLPPTYLARALLPSFDGQLFTEYIGFVGVVGLGLAIIGAIGAINHRRHRVWIAFVLLGLLFAIGRYTGVYLLIAQLPGFDLFRVPARWLLLYAFGAAMLAGYGLMILRSQAWSVAKLLSVFLPILALMVMAWLLPVDPIDIVGPAQPTMTTFLFWLLAVIALFVIILANRTRWIQSLVLIAITVELFLSAQILPYNDLVPRDVYLGQRFTISQMLAYTSDQMPPPRMLSISGRLFDLGDVDRLLDRLSYYGLDENARSTALTATKSQEILYPNLGLHWQIPTIDGYGGGVLPTVYYSQFSSLLLPEGVPRTLDGRIGEMLALPACRGACIPSVDLLQLTDTAYIITDKNFDVPYQGIFYDTSLAEHWTRVPERPDFAFDVVQVLLAAPVAGLDASAFQFRDTTYYLATLNWYEFADLINELDVNLLGATLVNQATGTFYQLTPGGFERSLSSDIKIYRVEGASRAGFAPQLAITPDDWAGHETALEILANDPTTLVVHGAPQRMGTKDAQAEITRYSDTRVEVSVTTPDDTYLYLADAHYPGWRATVNGEPVPIYRANVMFRAIPVPAGSSTVIFEFVPVLWYWALGFGLLMWILLLLLLGLRRSTMREGATDHA